MHQHLLAAEQATGRPAPELDVPPLPALCGDVWRLFLELHKRRTRNGFAPAPIDEARLLQWQQLHGATLTPWEIEAIFLLDAAWLSDCEEQQAKKQKQNRPPAA